MVKLLFDITNPKIDEVVTAVEDAVDQYDVHGCLAFCDWVNNDPIGRDFMQKNRDKLSRLFVYSTFRSLPVQPVGVSLELLSSPQFLEGAYLNGLDLHDVFKGVLITTPSLEQRDEWKKNMLESLFKNSTPLFDHKGVVVTLGQWLREYDAKANKNKDYALSLVETIATKDYKELSREIKNYLKQVLELIRYLHASSVNLESDLEQMTAIGESGTIIHMKGQEIVPINEIESNNPVNNGVPVIQDSKLDIFDHVDSKNILNKNSRVYMKDVLTVKEDFHKKRINTEEIINYTVKAILNKEVVSVVALISLLADNASLGLLNKSKFGNQVLLNEHRNGLENDVDIVDTADIDSSRALGFIIKHILCNKLSLTYSEGAHIASDLIAIAREKGEKIDHVSYYDEADGQYHWL